MSVLSVSASSSSLSATRPGGAGGASALSDAERRTVARMQQRDRDVRAHELAHITAGGGLITRGAAYTYETGPDGQRYAVGGDVGIDVSPGRTPQETLARAEQVRRAALAPADPSAQDRQVAARADQMAFQAQQTIAAQATSGTDPTSDTPPPGSLIDVYA